MYGSDRYGDLTLVSNHSKPIERAFCVSKSSVQGHPANRAEGYQADQYLIDNPLRIPQRV